MSLQFSMQSFAWMEVHLTIPFYSGLLTKAEATKLYNPHSGNKLYAVGDISCDVNGSIEFLEKTTSIDRPFFSWNPATNEVSDEIDGEGIAVMGVDILPTELRCVMILNSAFVFTLLILQLVSFQR